MASLAAVEDRVLSESISSPPIALIRLGLEIDRQLRLLLAATGLLRQYTGGDPPKAVELLGGLTPELKRAISAFWQLRELIIRSGEGIQSSISVSAIDSGLRILRTLVRIPRGKWVVKHANVVFYTDQACTNVRRDVCGVVLEGFDPVGRSTPGDTFMELTRLVYSVGQEVSLEYLPESSLQGAAWYRDPETGLIQVRTLGIGRNLEFIGRDLSTI
jgi:hypothetical protein